MVLDNIGGPYLERNLRTLAVDGRLVTIGLQGGRKGELDMGLMLIKRLSVFATGLRNRPVEGPGGKGAIVAAVREQLWPLVAAGKVRPVIDRVLPMSEAASAHRALEAGEVFGKVLLRAR